MSSEYISFESVAYSSVRSSRSMQANRSMYLKGISVYLLIVAAWQLPRLGCGSGINDGPFAEVPHAGASPSFGPSVFRRSRVALSLTSSKASSGAGQCGARDSGWGDRRQVLLQTRPVTDAPEPNIPKACGRF